MAHLLAKLGRAALEPQLVNGVWHKAAISAKNAARLRREALLSGQCVTAWHLEVSVTCPCCWRVHALELQYTWVTMNCNRRRALRKSRTGHAKLPLLHHIVPR